MNISTLLGPTVLDTLANLERLDTPSFAVYVFCGICYQTTFLLMASVGS